MNLIYDVAHNIAKMEPYEVEGKATQLCVHRKGADAGIPAGDTRSCPIGTGRSASRCWCRETWGRASYVLVGQPGSMEHTFGSSCPWGRKADVEGGGGPGQQGPVDQE